MSGKTWDEMCPLLRGKAIGAGYIDHITGPRCMATLEEGPNAGLYFIAHTDEVVAEDQPLLIRTFRGKPMNEKARLRA